MIIIFYFSADELTPILIGYLLNLWILAIDNWGPLLLLHLTIDWTTTWLRRLAGGIDQRSRLIGPSHVLVRGQSYHELGRWLRPYNPNSTGTDSRAFTKYADGAKTSQSLHRWIHLTAEVCGSRPCCSFLQFQRAQSAVSFCNFRARGGGDVHWWVQELKSAEVLCELKDPCLP